MARAEARGLVRRAGSAGDGRSVTVELTPAGHALIERTVDELLRHEAALLAGLPAEQRERLSDLLRVLLLELSPGER